MTTTTTRCGTTIKNERRGSGCDATINNARRGSGGGGGGGEIGGRNKRGTATNDEIGCDDEMLITMTTAQ